MGENQAANQKIAALKKYKMNIMYCVVQPWTSLKVDVVNFVFENYYYYADMKRKGYIGEYSPIEKKSQVILVTETDFMRLENKTSQYACI